jgi:hypothetical protein
VYEEQKKATYGSMGCKMPKDWSPGLLKELLNGFDVKRPYIQILGVKQMGACLVKRNEAAPGRR